MNGWVFCCVVFVAAARVCYGECRFPQSLWCSSLEIAGKCQACVIDLVKNNEVQVPLIKCMMTTLGQPEANSKKCALDLGGRDWAEIKRCSRELEHQMAIRTKALKTPEDSNLPLVTVNGVLVGEISKQPGTDFVNFICQRYQGPFPYGSTMQQSNPSHTCHTA